MSAAAPGSKISPPPRDRLRLVSHFPGRLRVRAETFRVLPEVADAVAADIRAAPGVREVTTSKVTGSLLVVYEPRELELPRLVQHLVRAGGLAGIEVDADGEWMKKAPQGERVRETLGALNQSLRAFTGGSVDLRAAVPGSLGAMGVAFLLAGRRRVPEWYDLIFWGFVTFCNLNPPTSRASAPRTEGAHGDVDRG
jgi:hypothetical protein